jgi:hypothetical protein
VTDDLPIVQSPSASGRGIGNGRFEPSCGSITWLSPAFLVIISTAVQGCSFLPSPFSLLPSPTKLVGRATHAGSLPSCFLVPCHVLAPLDYFGHRQRLDAVRHSGFTPTRSSVLGTGTPKCADIECYAPITSPVESPCAYSVLVFPPPFTSRHISQKRPPRTWPGSSHHASP